MILLNLFKEYKKKEDAVDVMGQIEEGFNFYWKMNK